MTIALSLMNRQGKTCSLNLWQRKLEGINLTGISLKGISLTVIAIALTTPAIAAPVESNPQIEAVAAHLVGIMDTSAQAAANPKAPSVRMTTCTLAIAGLPEETYLYQEQALTQDLTHPYRQRLLHLYFDPSTQKIASQSYSLVQPQTWIGLCQKNKAQRLLTLGDRGLAVCTVWLESTSDGFVGETPPQGCPAKIRGAVAITNTIHLTEAGMDTWDRGLDLQGNQVWGAKDNAYQYRWLKRGED